MNRRFFLQGALSLGAITAAGLPALALPRIYGDGIRDDTDGLQAFIDGKPFSVDGEGIVARDGILAGDFRLARPLFFRNLYKFNFDASKANFFIDTGGDSSVMRFMVERCHYCNFSFGKFTGDEGFTIHFLESTLGGGLPDHNG